LSRHVPKLRHTRVALQPRVDLAHFLRPRVEGHEDRARRVPGAQRARRSEEHTSELQSQSNLVCRLLLEKKKNKIKIFTDQPDRHCLHNQTTPSNAKNDLYRTIRRF